MLVKFSPNLLQENIYEVNFADIENIDLRDMLSKYDVSSVRAVFKNRYDDDGFLKNNLAPSNKHFLESWRIIPISDFAKAKQFVADIKNIKGVQDAIIETPLILESAYIPDDTEYGSQWHLNDTINPNADIRAELAWQINRGRNDVIIAILDGGVDYNHPDLDPGDRSRVIAGYDTGDGNSNPIDDLPDGSESYGGHGTSIAGVVGAITNNNQGVAGIMWNCQIMPVKMVRSGAIRLPFIPNWEWNTTAFPSDVADAIDFAVNNGAHVINLSYGFASMGWPVNEVALRVPLLFQSLNNAYNNNMVITASMGNEGNSDVNYPAGFRHQVIAVGATNRLRQKASFSSIGPHINVSAPGVSIRTTARGSGTRTVSGTSFSAPIAAGVAGLIISQGKDRGFELTNDDVRNILERTADDIEPIGFNIETGHGKINAHAALEMLTEPNEFVHGVSYGGSSAMTNLSHWNYIGSKWGLAAGIYYNVDRYTITKRIDFDVPFCAPPAVWMRDRESVCLSAASPNNGYPFAQISNITETGFEVTYFTYYVRINSSGQTINKWVPATVANTKIAYTAVGELNPAGAAGPISGPTLVCNTATRFQLNSLPAGYTVSWSYSGNLVHGSAWAKCVSTTPCIHLQAANASAGGTGWVQATISGGPCGDVVLPKHDVWVGTPLKPTFMSGFLNDGKYFAFASPYEFLTSSPTNQEVNYYDWQVYNGTIDSGQGTGHIIVLTANEMDAITLPGIPPDFNVSVRRENTCGTSPWFERTGFLDGDAMPQEDELKLTISPNPASSNITVSEVNPSNDKTPWYLRLMNQQGTILVETTSTLPNSISLQGLLPGAYVLHAIQGQYVEQQVVLVK